MKNTKLINFAFVGLIALIAFSSCKDDEMKYDVMGNDGLVYARADAGNPSTGFLDMTVSNTIFGIFGADAKVSFPIRCTMPAKEEIVVSCVVDKSLVETYNQNNGTKYELLNDDVLAFNSATFSIKEGSLQCDSRVEISLNEDLLKTLKLGEYLVPLKLKMVSGGMNVSKMYNVVYVHLNVNNEASDVPFSNREKWTIAGCSSEEVEGESAAAVNVLDGNRNTFWHTCWANSQPNPPHYITIDMGEVVDLVGFQYLTRPFNRGCATELKIEVSVDSQKWTEIGTYDDLPQSSSQEFKVLLEAPIGARYFRYTILDSNEYYVAMAEINAYTVKK